MRLGLDEPFDSAGICSELGHTPMQGTIAELDLNQPAIVFWIHNPGEITRFERLEDAVHSVMVRPSAKLFSIAWITIRQRTLRQLRLISHSLGRQMQAAPISPRNSTCDVLGVFQTEERSGSTRRFVG